MTVSNYLFCDKDKHIITQGGPLKIMWEFYTMNSLENVVGNLNNE